MSLSQYKEKKRGDKVKPTIKDILARVTECTRVDTKLFEITVSIEFVDRTAEFTIERSYADIVGLLKLVSKQNEISSSLSFTLLQECFEENTQNYM